MAKTALSQNEYVAMKRKQLDDWNGEITAFAEGASKTKTDASEKFHRQLLAARKNYEDSSKKLDAVRLSPNGAWEGLKAETESLFVAFRSSVNQFKARF